MSDAAKAPVIVKRHAGVVRATHWINAIAVFFLLFSGLQIFNAHPAVYWGEKSHFASPWLAMKADGGRGVTTLGDLTFDTDGVFGVSTYAGRKEVRGMPWWLTLPSYRNLALARTWHFFFVWIFVINGLVYLVSGLLTQRLQRDLIPTRADLRNIGPDIVHHLKLQFPRGEAAARYQVLQRLSYVGMALIVLPLLVITGMTMSPGLNAAFPWLLDLVGGRQSGRSIHFICAGLTALFIVVHLVMVLASGPINQIRAMITGNYVLPPEKEPAS